jgi:predicted TIM-barrel fold metal-dependent hydrolase
MSNHDPNSGRADAAPTDVHTWVGGYPFRHVPHPDPDVLVRVLDREQVADAWVGHLPSAFYRDPTPGNDELTRMLAPYRSRLQPTPTIRPDWPQWERGLLRARDDGAPAVRAYPPQWGLGPGDRALRELTGACGEHGLVLLLTTRFEDGRQRHWMDAAGDLPAATVRDLARVSPGAHLIVTGAGRATIEEVHWGLTAEERARLWWDISWIWGPPEDDLAHLIATIGAERFVYGSGWPLRLAQMPRANLDLLPSSLASVRLACAADIAASAHAASAHVAASAAARGGT